MYHNKLITDRLPGGWKWKQIAISEIAILVLQHHVHADFKPKNTHIIIIHVHVNLVKNDDIIFDEYLIAIYS